MKKIRVAFIKFNGLASGGSEKLMQIIAANLPKDQFSVDYFYTDYSENGETTVSTDRMQYLREHGVTPKLISVKKVNTMTPWLKWEGTNFDNVFDESEYDIVQTCRWGIKEYPFYKIKKIPIVDIIGYLQGVDNQYNIARVMQITQWSANEWIKKGGDASRIVYISLPISIPEGEVKNMREELGLQGKFVYGFHQRPDDKIFSDFPLASYKKIETDDTAFVLLGGSALYHNQAKELGIKNIHFLAPTGDQKTICSFLETLDVYAHGRRDGEINSQAMAEAMYCALPIVSHWSTVNNGHVECIADAGRVVSTHVEYAEELRKLKDDKVYYQKKSAASKKRFEEKYELKKQIVFFAEIYKDVLLNPYPHRLKRMVSVLYPLPHIRLIVRWVYNVLKHAQIRRKGGVPI